VNGAGQLDSLPAALARQLESYRGRGVRVFAPGMDADGLARIRALCGADADVAGEAQPPQAVDIVLDCRGDSGQVLETFAACWPGVAAGGLFLCATGDPAHSRPLRAWFSALLDDIHAFHKRGKKPEEFRETAYTRSVDSVHFYPGWIAVEQRPREAPKMVYTGEPQF